jgi:hypothetical protein
MSTALLLTFAAIAAPNREPAGPIVTPRKPVDMILGDWFYENLTQGKPAVGVVKPNLGIRFLPGETIFMFNGNPSPGDGLTAKVVIDWSQTPVTIDFMPMRGGTMRGILKFEGEHLYMAICTSDGPRATDFHSPQFLVGKCTRIKH